MAHPKISIRRRAQTIVLLCGAVAGLCGAWLRPGTQAALPARPQSERGRTLYGQHCARCHGADGRAQTEQGELYGATDFTDARWWQSGRSSAQRMTGVISHGKRGGMPAFGRRLTRADIAALVAYVRTFKP